MIATSPKLQGQKAINVLRVASAGVGGQTVVIGTETYELTTKDDLSVTSGRTPVDVSAGSTVKARGRITFSVAVPAEDETVTIGGKAYTFKDAIIGDDNADGNVKIGATIEATVDNLIAAINRTSALAGVSYAVAMVKHTTVTGVKSGTDKVLPQAISGGTAGNAITLAKSATNIAVDAAVLGTERAGVDPTASEVLTALETTINAETEQDIEVDKISTTHLLLRARRVGVVTLACTETLAGSNNAWAAAAMYGGSRTRSRKMAHLKRVPTAVEVGAGVMHFELPFTPTVVIPLVAITLTPGIQKGWDGVITIDGGHVQFGNAGSTDWAATDTVEAICFE